MKRKFIIFVFMITYFFSLSAGLASLLAANPGSMDLEPSARIQQYHNEKAPITIAGGSWGGIRDGSCDKKKDSPRKGCGGVKPNGGSWGG